MVLNFADFCEFQVVFKTAENCRLILIINNQYKKALFSENGMKCNLLVILICGCSIVVFFGRVPLTLNVSQKNQGGEKFLWTYNPQLCGPHLAALKCFKLTVKTYFIDQLVVKLFYSTKKHSTMMDS